MRFEQVEAVKDFLNEVAAQIEYKPMRPVINEELAAHIEDKVLIYQEYGLEEKTACEKAVRDMGDAQEIGKRMNEAHRLRIHKPLLIGILLALCLGMLGNFVGYQGFTGGPALMESIWYSGYFVWGIFLLVLIMYCGYTVILKGAKWIAAAFLAGCIGLLALRLILRLQMDAGGEWRAWSGATFALFSPSLTFGILLLSIPVIAILMYRRRKQGLKGFLLVFGCMAAVILFAVFSRAGSFAYVPVLTLLLSCTGIMLYMVGKGYISGGKKKNVAAVLAGFAALLVLWAAPQWKQVERNLQMFVNPKTQAVNAWQDAYNNVLIRELLSRAELLGEIRLSEEELVRYGTAQWYYEDGPGMWEEQGKEQEEAFQKYVDYRLQFLDHPTLRDILPQHYHNNYRIAWWILEYGWIPAILLTLLLLTAYFFMFRTVLQIKNHLGRTVAFGSSLTLSVQLVSYLLGNFGCQFGAFGNLPFVSEGLVSISISAVLAGMLLSAYRYDMVIEEKAYKLEAE